MLYRFDKKLIYKLFALIFLPSIFLSGCVTGKSINPLGLNPLDIIPEGASLYVNIKESAQNIPVINKKLEEFSVKMGVPKSLKDRTDNIAAVFFDDNWGYIVTQGSYPDFYIKDRLEKEEGWEVGNYQKVKYYFSNNAKTLIILLNNMLIVSDFPAGNGSANLRAKRIIDIIMSNDAVTYPLVTNSVFHITSKNAGNIFTQFVAENVSLDTVNEVNFNIILDPKNKKTGGINITYMVEDEKKALLFNSVIRLFISDYVVKKKITDVKSLRDNNSIYYDGVFVYVNILDIPIEKLNMFIADFIGEANWLLG